MILSSAPSSSRTLERICSATYNNASSSISLLCSKAFCWRIATLVSKLGTDTSMVRPCPNLVLKRSSRVLSSFGSRSLVKTICFFELKSSLKVWKNSSCVASLFFKNWTSSTKSASAALYLLLNLSPVFSLIDVINSFIKFSLETYIIFAFGLLALILLPIACIKCVFPSPLLP